MSSPWTPARLIAALAARGNAPAIITMTGGNPVEWPAAALAEDAARLAGGLLAAGLAPGEPVGLHGPNGPDWIAARLAIGAAGGVPVAVDDLTAAGDAAPILARAGCRWHFTTAAHAAALPPEAGFRLVLLDGGDAPDGWRALRAATAGPLPDAAPEAEAMLVTTSGTTGAPKLFALTHANLDANLSAVLAVGLVGPQDRMLLPLPLHHVYPFLVGLMTPIAAGAALVLPETATGPDLVRALRETRATILVGVPRIYVALLAGLRGRVAARGALARAIFEGMLEFSASLRRGGLDPGRRLFGSVHAQMAPALRVLVCGGARLDGEDVWALEALGWRVCNGYGLAETASLFTGNTPAARRVGSEGRALAPGSAVRIADPDAQGIGEIQLKGPNVFAGYRDNPEANAAAFTADGWFRTGDLGRLDTDGFLHATGRLKELIVLGGGKNVMPEEVEAAYAAHPAIREIAVLDRAGALVGVVVPDEAALRAAGATRPEDALRVALTAAGQGLAPYQRLAGYVVAREPLPRTRLGKIQRFRLPEMYEALRAGRAAPPPPLTPEDEALLAQPGAREAWDILAARYPGRPLSPAASPALDLGIDSLEWVALALELEQRIGLRLGEEDIAAIGTVRDLLERAREAHGAGATPPAPRGTAEIAAEAERMTRPPSPALLPLRAAGWAAARGIGAALFSLETRGREHLPRRGPFVIVANHVSDLDPGLIAASLPFGLMRRLWWGGVKERLFVTAASRAFARAFQVFPVEERQPSQAVAMARAVLARGEALAWFPESWRSPDGALQRFLPGIGLILDGLPGVPVIPAHIRGAFEAMPRDRRLPRRHPVRITYGPPVAPALLAPPIEDPRRRAEAVADALHDAVAALAAEAG
jgi:long-chain acyl-CoA synthetase